MSVAFTKEESAETAAETLLPDRPIPEGPNLVTVEGLRQIEAQLAQARAAYEAANALDDVNERRRQAASPYRDLRYFSERLRTAQIVPPPTSAESVAFGSTVEILRSDGRRQSYRIVGEDEADPRHGTISFTSPIGRVLLGRQVGDEVALGPQSLEIVAIS